MVERDMVILRDRFMNPFEEHHPVEGEEEKEKKECPICLSEFEAGEMVITHPRCGHVFHSDCLTNWLIRPNYPCYCPMCKTPTLSSMLREIRKQVQKEKENIAGQIK